MKRRLACLNLICILSVLAPSLGRAAIQILGVTGSSNYETVDGFPMIYGGITSSNRRCAANTSCNSCQGGSPLQSCNEHEITPATNLTIRFVSTEAGLPQLTYGFRGMEGVVAIGYSVPANTEVTLSVPWSNLCVNQSICQNGANCDVTCSSGFSAQLNLGVNGHGGFGVLGKGGESVGVNIQLITSTCNIIVPPSSGLASGMNCVGNYGIHGFTVKPGNRSISLINLESHAGFPNRGDTQFRKVRAYYGLGSCSQVANVRNNSPYVESQIVVNKNGEIGLASNSFKGFKNNSSYVFKLAQVDSAGNVDYFSPDESCNNAIPDENRTGNSRGGGGAWTAGLGTHVGSPHR